jgi:radical SAM protein with 4Fe4S-binding SPASM domain
MKMKDVFILNPDYTLKLDKNRIIITNKSNQPSISTMYTFTAFVHPVYAVIISFFDGEKKLYEVEADISRFFNKDRSVVSDLISPLLENKEMMNFNYDGKRFTLPKNLLVKKEYNQYVKKIDYESFLIPKENLDMESVRLNYPLDIMFMINTRCITDCVYCFADKKMNMDCQIPLERLKELILEARKLEMRSFDITGGELFLYKYWEILLEELLANGFIPYISTKCAIDVKTINKLKDLGIRGIQLSVDSVIENELMEMWRVGKHYRDSILKTLKNLDENDFEIYINTQITSINQYNIDQLIDSMLKLKNIKRLTLGPAGFSLYKTESQYRQYRPDLERIKKLEENVNDLKAEHGNRIYISFSGYNKETNLINLTREEKKNNFYKRSRCSANFYALILLPDGKATICEELYWHPHFIIGDLSKQSIEEVWNSARALELYNISRDMIKEGSACKNCDEFASCHRLKGVCWKEVLYAYGYDNWDYPDPKCPYAPKPFREYYL